MITKRNGHGQTECRGCKDKGKFALNWDSFLYNFDNEPYCLDCLMEKLEQFKQENEILKRKVKNLKRKIRKLKNKNYVQQDEFVIYLQKKKYDYAGANFPKDDLFDEVQEILEKYNEVTGVFDRWEKEVSNALDKDIEEFFKECYAPMQTTTN